MALGMGLEVTIEPTHALVRIHGDVDMETAPRLDEALRDLPDTEHVVIDLGDVDFLDSSGLTVLVEHTQRLARRAPPGDLRLVGPRPAVTKVLDVAGLTGVLAVFESYAAAVQGL